MTISVYVGVFVVRVPFSRAILQKMDNNEVSLEESFELYNEGLNIVKELNGKLSEVEGKLTIVNEEQQI